VVPRRKRIAYHSCGASSAAKSYNYAGQQYQTSTFIFKFSFGLGRSTIYFQAFANTSAVAVSMAGVINSIKN
jgi:hypothetical protein